MTLRYVVLHHTGIASPHFDLLYESGPGGLLTSFRCPRWPPCLGDAIEELPEHRRDYLDYEGDISDRRGTVRRIESGTVDSIDVTIDPPAFALSFSLGIRMLLTHHVDADGRMTCWAVTSLSS